MPTFPKYESYKDSGVEWLGDIPSHWNVSRLKHSIKSAANGMVVMSMKMMKVTALSAFVLQTSPDKIFVSVLKS
jgi:hypothetical protein